MPGFRASVIALLGDELPGAGNVDEGSATRTGDTPQAERAPMARRPAADTVNHAEDGVRRQNRL